MLNVLKENWRVLILLSMYSEYKRIILFLWQIVKCMDIRLQVFARLPEMASWQPATWNWMAENTRCVASINVHLSLSLPEEMF